MPTYALRGFPEEASVYPGTVLTLRVACLDISSGYNIACDYGLASAPYVSRHPLTEYRVVFYRQGKTLEAVHAETDWMCCELLTYGSPNIDWGTNAWAKASYQFTIPLGWRSGVYIAVLAGRYWSPTLNDYVIVQPSPLTADDRAAKVLFVILGVPSSDSRILYKVPLNTYHAYNYEGGGSLYDTFAFSVDRLPQVTMRRPGGGTGGIIGPSDYGNPDYYDTSSPRQTFAHWDALFISWLEAQPYAVDYCTDCDIDGDEKCCLLSHYNLLLSVGHDEYWSDGMRANVSTFIRIGGNVAFFSGNTCWWRIVYDEPEHVTFTCDKEQAIYINGNAPEAPAGHWWAYGYPENLLTGMSYRAGGGHWSGWRPAVGYKVQRCDHWVYADTGLKDGQVFGEADSLIGYECDGVHLTFDSPQQYARATGHDQTPSTFTILGYGGPLDPSWQDLPANETWAKGHGLHFATMGLNIESGYVFNGGTTDWARVLITNADVQKLTRNVLDKLQIRQNV